jgi:hypothetical protein
MQRETVLCSILYSCLGSTPTKSRLFSLFFTSYTNAYTSYNEKKLGKTNQ